MSFVKLAMNRIVTVAPATTSFPVFIQANLTQCCGLRLCGQPYECCCVSAHKVVGARNATPNPVLKVSAFGAPKSPE
jgi:hypothetical protein